MLRPSQPWVETVCDAGEGEAQLLLLASRGGKNVASVDEWVVPIVERTDATLSLDAPKVTVSGVRLGLYPRAGTNETADMLTTDPVPLTFTGPRSFQVPRALLQRADEVFVEASVSVKQPTAAAGTVTVSGHLVMGARKSDLSADFELKDGDTGGVLDLTWWLSAT